MAEENNATSTEEQTTKNSQFALQRIYLKDLSFEAPMGVAALNLKVQPKVEQDLNTQARKVAEDLYEVVLQLTVSAKLKEEKTAFLVEVQQAGLFRIVGIEEPHLPHLFNTHCAKALFPYAREAIDNVVVKGGFPALQLPPINFDVLFAHAMREARSKNAEGAATEEASGDTRQ